MINTVESDSQVSALETVQHVPTNEELAASLPDDIHPEPQGIASELWGMFANPQQTALCQAVANLKN